MPSVVNIKNEREFYNDFGMLVNVLKTVAIAQFHALEKKIQTYEELIKTVEKFFGMIDLKSINHPFIHPSEEAPLGVVAVTSERGLLGGLNSRVINAALGCMQTPHNKLIIVGQQGQNYVQGLNVFYKGYTLTEDENRYARALEIKDYIIEEVLEGRMGAVKIFYPFATSIQVQNVMSVDILPCTAWEMEESNKWNEFGDEIIFESYPSQLVEFLVYLSLGQKIYEILQFAHLAEYAARTIHLEESGEKIKEIDKKLQLKYFHARHEIIDQQMRELFAARSLYVEEE